MHVSVINIQNYFVKDKDLKNPHSDYDVTY